MVWAHSVDVVSETAETVEARADQRANEGVGDVEAALADLRAAEKIDPHDALIQSALNNFTSVFHIAVVLDRASPEVLARQPAWRNFKPETRP